MIDNVRIWVRAGDGGDGAVSFRREKFVPHGGPDGGNGGKGGDIYLVADGNVNTLRSFSYKQHFVAPNGRDGQGQERSGGVSYVCWLILIMTSSGYW